MQINLRQAFAKWRKRISLTSLLLILTGLVAACGDSTSTPASVTTVATTTVAPITQPTTVAPTTTQPAATTVPANTTAAAPSTQVAGSGQTAPLFEDRTSPPNLVKAFYNAINRKEYQRAYSYWQVTGAPNTPAGYDEFAKGYADTASVTFTLGQIMQDAGAGQLYAKIPTVLVATHASGKQETFAGCYIAHRVNTGISTNPADELWRFTSGTLAVATAGAEPKADSCNSSNEGRLTGAFNDQSSPENLVKSYYNAISLSDYQRAYSYWENPGKGNTNTPGSFDQFAKGYSDTTSVFYTLGKLTSDAGAGQLYASIPIVLTSTQTGGSKTIFAGCYVAHRVNDGVSTNPADKLWRFRSGTLTATSANAQPDAKSCTP